jgi:hypothetical protein
MAVCVRSALQLGALVRRAQVQDNLVTLSVGSIIAIVLGIICFCLLITIWILVRRSSGGGSRRR